MVGLNNVDMMVNEYSMSSQMLCKTESHHEEFCWDPNIEHLIFYSVRLQIFSIYYLVFLWSYSGLLFLYLALLF